MSTDEEPDVQPPPTAHAVSAEPPETPSPDVVSLLPDVDLLEASRDPGVLGRTSSGSRTGTTKGLPRV